MRLLQLSLCLLVTMVLAPGAWAATPDCRTPGKQRVDGFPSALKDISHLEGGRPARASPPSARRYALYYGASWCGPCRLLARKLRPIYAGDRPGAAYEVIFVSLDRTPAAALDYIRRELMPWPFVRPERLASGRGLAAAGGSQAPNLIVVDAQGLIYCSAYDKDGRYRGAFETFQAMRAALGLNS